MSRGKLSGPPEVFVWHTVTLKASMAWRGKSASLCALLDALEVENMKHAGLDNGRLMATYNQLVQFGMRRNSIRGAIREGIRRGLLRLTEHGRNPTTGKGILSRYRLTYLPTVDAPPTDEWKRYLVAKSLPGAQSRKPSTEDATEPVTEATPGEIEKPSSSAKNRVANPLPRASIESATSLYISEGSARWRPAPSGFRLADERGWDVDKIEAEISLFIAACERNPAAASEADKAWRSWVETRG
jgi:hypothetical protein